MCRAIDLASELPSYGTRTLLLEAIDHKLEKAMNRAAIRPNFHREIGRRPARLCSEIHGVAETRHVRKCNDRR